MYLCSFRILFF